MGGGMVVVGACPVCGHAPTQFVAGEYTDSGNDERWHINDADGAWGRDLDAEAGCSPLRRPVVLEHPDTEKPWHAEIRPDIERYAETEGVSFESAWQVLNTPFVELSDEQIALMAHLIKWCVRDFGLEGKVSVDMERG